MIHCTSCHRVNERVGELKGWLLNRGRSENDVLAKISKVGGCNRLRLSDWQPKI